jgi:transcriptional regulator with XRE-family HTH domain
MKRNKNSLACKFKIGSYIRKWRNIKDIKQKDLAAALQISEAAVSNIENDLTNITVGQLDEISIALNISIEQLLTDPQEKYKIPPANINSMIVKEDQQQLDKELLNAIIASMEKKDQQLQVIMQNFLHAMTTLMQQEKTMINSSKQATSRV